MLEYELPTSVILNDTAYAIRRDGDFRMVLDCFRILQDEDLTQQEKLLASLIVFYADIDGVDELYKLKDKEQAIKEMFRFFNCGKDNDTVGIHAEGKVLDWDKDALMIISAVNAVAGKEIRAEKYLHWWTFISYYMAVGESPLSTVVNIRRKRLKGKKLEKYEQEYVKNNPELFNWDTNTSEDREALDAIYKAWNSGGQ